MKVAKINEFNKVLVDMKTKEFWKQKIARKKISTFKSLKKKN